MPQSTFAVPAGQSSTPCFPAMDCCAVVRGAYPPQLAAAWRAFANGPNKCENDNPMELLADDQPYLVMVSSNGGRDLEKSDVPSFAAAKSMLCQVRCSPPAASTLPDVLDVCTPVDLMHVSSAASLHNHQGGDKRTRLKSHTASRGQDHHN